MKKSKLLILSGAIILAITGLFATKKYKRYGPVPVGYILGSSVDLDPSIFTNVDNNHTVILRTRNGTTLTTMLTSPGGGLVFIK